MPYPLSSKGRSLLDDLVTATRTIGSDSTLVLHGGGNTSAKLDWFGPDGVAESALLIKGSGQDMAAIDAAGFVPLELARVRRLLPPTTVGAPELASALRAASLDPAAPDPSVETLVHAAIPARVVLHSHADAVLAVTDSVQGRDTAQQIWGESVAYVDYATPGYPLGAAVAELVGVWGKPAPVNAIVVLGHGLFTFAETVSEALAEHERVISLARNAIRFWQQTGAGGGRLTEPTELSTIVKLPSDPAVGKSRDWNLTDLSALRKRLSEILGNPQIVTRHRLSPVETLLNSDPELLREAARGVATPDHVTWLGPWLALDADIDVYSHRYEVYEQEALRLGAVGAGGDDGNRESGVIPKAIVSEQCGFLTVGSSPHHTAAVADIVEHTVAIARDARAFGGYLPPSPVHVYELEHWSAQQAKATRRRPQGVHAGKIALVTGAASGIGRAIARALHDDGAAVVAWDISPLVADMSDSDRRFGQCVDVTDAEAQQQAIAEAVERFGGIDIVVPAAGIFPAAKHLKDLDDDLWQRTLAINVTSVQTLFRLVYPHLVNAVDGGRVVVVASKNVAAPGPGAAAYSASKAALNQLARVAALEWAGDGIRVNVVNPDAVFDTGLWTPELLAQRADHYGLSVEQYKRRNLLRTEVTSRQVGRLVSVMASSVFDSTTGAQVPIDGGNERVI